MDKWCMDPALSGLLTEEKCDEWAKTADHFSGVAEDPDKDAVMALLDSMFEAEAEILEIAKFVSGCGVKEKKDAIQTF
jgi:hypothetical protein